MKKAVFGLVAGLVLGAFATWIVLSHEPTQVADAEEDDASVVPVAAEESVGVHLSHEEQTSAGLIIASPQSGQLAPETVAFGRVLDPAPLVALVTEVEAAQAAVEASEMAFTRTQKLHAADGNASTQALESAQAAVTRDRAQFAGARARLTGDWGAILANLDDRTAFLQDLVMQTSALIRIDLPSGETPSHAPSTVRAGTIDANDLHRVDIIGPAASVDARMQGTAYLGIWKGEAPAIGTALRVLVPTGDEPQSVWLVPRAALTRHQGSVFVFVRNAAETFSRRRVVLAEPQKDNVPVIEGLNGGDQVVVTGAQQLLSAELDAGGEPD